MNLAGTVLYLVKRKEAAMIESTHIRVSRAVQEALRRKSAQMTIERDRRVTITEVIEDALKALETQAAQ